MNDENERMNAFIAGVYCTAAVICGATVAVPVGLLAAFGVVASLSYGYAFRPKKKNDD